MARGLQKLTAKNFGILGDVTVELGRLNVLVGPNGSGKTTLLRVIQFLGDAARSQLAMALQDHGGWERVATRADPPTPQITIEVTAVVTSHAHSGAPDEYTLSFKPLRLRAPDGTIRQATLHEESFKFKRTARQGRRITLKGGLLLSIEGTKRRKRSLNKDAFGLAVLPQLGPEDGGDEIRKIQELFTNFRVFDVDARRARAPSDARETTPLRANAENLAGFLGFLHDEHFATFTDLVDDAKIIVPGLADLRLRPVGGAVDAVAVDIVDKHLPGFTPLADASFGTVRALALLAMLYDPSPPLVTCVEEIDHGLHPHVFDRLVELLRSASERTQLLVATHSPALVNRLHTSELIVCERDLETGLARIPAVDPDEIARICEGSVYGLGELWFSGTLGGVPR